MKYDYSRRMVGIALIMAIFVAADGAGVLKEDNAIKQKELKFSDAHAQALEFIAYYHSISLTPEQEKIKLEALEPIPAPCCKDHSIATCCCPCNLAKSVWGLSHFLVKERNYNAQQLRAAVQQWIRFTNKIGYAGNACYKKRCNRPFGKDGCGGMDEGRVL